MRFRMAANVAAGTAVLVGLPQGVGMTDRSGGRNGRDGPVSRPLSTATTRPCRQSSTGAPEVPPLSRRRLSPCTSRRVRPAYLPGRIPDLAHGSRAPPASVRPGSPGPARSRRPQAVPAGRRGPARSGRAPATPGSRRHPSGRCSVRHRSAWPSAGLPLGDDAELDADRRAGLPVPGCLAQLRLLPVLGGTVRSRNAPR